MQKAFEVFPDSIFLISHDGTFLDFKGNENKMFIPPEQFLNKKIIDLVPRSIAKLQMEALEKVIKTGEVQNIELSIPKDNPEKYYELRFVKFTNNSIIAFARDITDFKKAKDDLRTFEEYYRALLENFQGIAFQGYQDFSTAFFRGAVEDITGYTEEDFISGTVRWDDLIHFDDLPIVSKKIIDFHKNKKKSRDKREYRIINKKGEVRWILELIEKFYDTLIDKEGVRGIVVDITENKLIEQKLKESEEKYRLITENANDMIAVLNEKMEYEFVNEAAYQKIMGRTKHNLIGKNPMRWTHPDDVERCIKIYKEGWEKGEAQVQARFRDEEGKYHWLEIKGKTFIDPKRMRKALIVSRDITERKEAEQKLQESEEKYRNIINNLLDIVIILDLKGNFQYVSPQVYEISGFRPEELIGKSGFKFMHPNDIKNAIGILKEAMEKKKRVYIEYRTIHKDGHYIDVSASGRIVNIEGENRIFAIVRDISYQKRAEEKLIESEEKYRYFIENSLEGVWVIDAGANTVLVNPSMAKILGFSVDEMIGKSLFSFMDEKEAEITKTHLEKRKKGISEERDAVFTHKEGKKVYLRIRASPIFDNEGNYEGTYAFLADITQRKLAEQKIKESEEKFRRITEQSLMGVAILQDDEIKYANQKLADTFGYEVEEILSWNKGEFIKTIDPEFQDLVIEQVRKKQQGSKDVLTHYKFKGIKKTGEEIWLENYSKPIEYKHGTADLVTLIDITEQKITEENLKESEEMFRNIAEQSLMGIAILQDDVYKYVNQQFLDTIGYSYEEIINWKPKEYRKLIHPDYRLFMMEQAKKKQKGMKDITPHYEFKGIKKNGKSLWAEIFSKTIKYNGRNADLITRIDITDKKEAEEKLRESEEMFRTIAEQAFIGVLIIQDDGIKYANNALLKIFEYHRDDIDGMVKNDLLRFIHPEDLQYLREYRKKLRLNEENIKPYYSYRVFTNSGKKKWIDQFSKEIIYKGKPAELVMIMDVSEKKQAEQELVKLNNLKSEFLRRTSHELKTPLVSIKGFSDLLLTVHKENLDDYILATIHEIKLGCERLENLIQDILKTSELETKSIKLKKKREDLSFLIKLCVRELQGLIRLRNHTVNLKIHDRLTTSFEPEQIHLVISNLLNNALKYSPPNGEVEITTVLKENFIIISIKDTGIGITEGEKARLFTQFGKIERYGQGLDIISDGSGLGLYISKKIIELHDGKIWVESEGRNQGSTFYFSLPLITEETEI